MPGAAANAASDETIKDVTFAADHRGQRGARGMEDADQIDVDDPLERQRIDLQHRSVARDAGVGNHHVDAAEFRDSLLGGRVIAARSRTSATTVRTRSSPPSSPEIADSAAASTSVSTNLAPLACKRRATSAPIPWAPPVMNTTCELTDVMAATYPLLPR